MKFNPGDEVLVVEGDFKGQRGTVEEFIFESYMVDITADHTGNVRIACKEEELGFPPQEKNSEEEVTDLPVHGFGISQAMLSTHLQWLIGRSLEKVGEVGPDQAFFGFQEFEGKTPQEVLLEIMGKLEEGVAMFAQAHVLVGRIVMAMEAMNDQDE